MMDETKEVESCLSCKLTTVACLFGIGGYLLQQSKNQKRPSKVSLIVLGTGSIFLGVGELFDRSPFRKYTN